MLQPPPSPLHDDARSDILKAIKHGFKLREVKDVEGAEARTGETASRPGLDSDPKGCLRGRLRL